MIRVLFCILLTLPLLVFTDFGTLRKMKLKELDDAADGELRFESWVQKHGVGIHGVSFPRYPQPRVVATQHLDALTKILTVPLSATITELTARNHAVLGPILAEYENSIQGRSALAVLLMYEKNNYDNSEWKLYLDMFPKELNTPMFWKKSQRDEITGTWLLDRVNADLDAIIADYDRVFTKSLTKGYPNIFPSKEYSLSSYLWAWGIIFDYTVRIEDETSDYSGLMPVSHLFEHHSKHQTLFSIEGDNIIIKVGDTYDENDKVFRSYYTDAPNTDLLRKHGIVQKDNENHIFPLNLNFKDNEPYLNTKKKWMALHDIPIPNYPYSEREYFLSSKGASGSVPAFLRVKHYKIRPNDVGFPEKLPNPHEDQTEDNKDVERQVVFELADIMKKSMAAYPTTLEEDLELLKRDDLPERQYLAVVARLSEKLALKSAQKEVNVRKVKEGEQFSFFADDDDEKVEM